MPSVPTHCKNSKKRTGEEFADLHEWMDKPKEILGKDHRKVRHDLSYLNEVRARWGVKGVREFLRHIAEDYLDTAENWGQKCKTTGCEEYTYKKYKYCNNCFKAKKGEIRLEKFNSATKI